MNNCPGAAGCTQPLVWSGGAAPAQGGLEEGRPPCSSIAPGPSSGTGATVCAGTSRGDVHFVPHILGSPADAGVLTPLSPQRRRPQGAGPTRDQH